MKLINKLTVAGVAITAAFTTANPARAEIEIINRNGFRMAFSFQGAIAGFSTSNIDFGVGNLDTNGTRRRQNRAWGETYAKPLITGEWASGRFGTFYFGGSFITSFTFGEGDALSGLAPQALRSSTSSEPSWTAIEDLYGGWRSADLFPSLGSNAIDISGGYQTFTVGDGLVIGDGTAEGWGRAALYLGPRTAFHNTAILRFSPSEWGPVRGTVFHLSTNTNQHRMLNNDQAESSLVGGTVEWYQAAPQVEGQPPVPDYWQVTGLYFNIYNADSNPALCFVNQAPGCAAPGATANRDGLNVFSIRAGGAFFPQNRDILTWGEFVYQLNDSSGRRVRAYAWYLEGGYRFSQLPWSPTVSFRYAQFSGDSSTTDGTDHSYDPLFFTSGLRQAGPGTWYLGEIYGQYLGPPTNLHISQFHVRASPTDQINVGVLYYLADFAEPAQYGVTRGSAFHEIDVYLEWNPRPWLSVVPTFGVNIPRGGYRDIAQNAVIANGQDLNTPTSRNIYLVQAVLAVKF